MRQSFIRSRRVIAGASVSMPFIETAGYDSFSRSIALSEHSHAGYEIVYLVRGRTVWTLPDKKLTLSGGNVSIVQPGVRHLGELSVIEPGTIFWVIIDLSRVREHDVGRKAARAFASVFSNAGNSVFPVTDALAAAFMQFYHAVLSDGAERDVLLRASLLSIVSAAALGLRTPPRQKKTPQLSAAVDHIRENLSGRIAVRELARMCRMSASAFHENFLRTFGVSPAEYIIRERIER